MRTRFEPGSQTGATTEGEGEGDETEEADEAEEEAEVEEEAEAEEVEEINDTDETDETDDTGGLGRQLAAEAVLTARPMARSWKTFFIFVCLVGRGVVFLRDEKNGKKEKAFQGQ